jgi:general secretion pathway protein D
MIRRIFSARSRPFAGVGLSFVFGIIFAGALLAGEGGAGLSGLANKEVAKREAQMAEAQALVSGAQTQLASGDFSGAMKNFRDAWVLVPDAPATAVLKASARDGYSRAANAQARKLAKEARYDDAKAVLATILEEDFDPTNADARLFKKQIDDPDRFEPALTPAHIANVEKVNELLRLGNGLISLGDYDGARDKFWDVLRIDRTNTAARKGIENVEQHRERYFSAARDQTRAARLAEVNGAWEQAVPPALDVTGLFGGSRGGPVSAGATGGKQAILNKLRTLIVPVVDLQGATLEEVVEFLRARSRDLDPQRVGIGFVLRAPPEALAKPVTLGVAQVPLEEVLRYVTQMTGTTYRADEFAVTITGMAEKSATLVNKSYRVPPDFISTAPVDGPASAPATAPPDPFGQKPAAGGGGGITMRRVGAREFLEQRGVTFPEGASATLVPTTSTLIVRNTVENLAVIDDLVEQASTSAPKQVEVSIRMIEVNDARLNEMGFDWLLGAFNIPGSSALFGSGGTVGNQAGSVPTTEDFPIGFPGGTAPVGTNPVTAGLRSSGAILGVPSIDGLLRGGQVPARDSRSPGQFAVAGVFTDPQFQAVIRALSQTKGVDILAQPSVVTKSGVRASVVISREFIYPTEFAPPQIPTSVGSTAGPGGVTAFPITPTTPTAFAKRDVGITLEVEPVVDNRRVDLSLTPSATQFEGFVDYGTPIGSGLATGVFGSQALTVPNHILQPIFRSNKATSSVSVWDGQTVAIAGVITEKKQAINDKVPIIGDLPLIGRTFQSKVTLTERKNVVIYVTVRVLDPSGNRVYPSGPATVSAP